MKKILLFVIGLALFTACKNDDKVCKIEGHDCWNIVKLANNKQYKDLEAMGLKVSDSSYFKDGGSTIITLNDKVNIFTNHSFKIGKITLEDGSTLMIPTPYNSELGYVTVTFKKDGREFIFDPQGNLKEYFKPKYPGDVRKKTQAKNTYSFKDEVCQIEGSDCWKVVQLLKQSKKTNALEVPQGDSNVTYVTVGK